MRSYRTGKFKSLFQSLSPEIQSAARKTYRLWLRDPRHPSLHFKPVRSDVWSIRITHGYRAVGYVRNGNIYWHWIGAHDEYERIIQTLA